MTKLVEWFLAIGIFISIWCSIIFYPSRELAKWHTLILLLPLAIILVFGITSVAIVLWRTYNFNDCKEASQELQKEIDVARDDLKKRGFKFEKQ